MNGAPPWSRGAVGAPPWSGGAMGGVLTVLLLTDNKGGGSGSGVFQSGPLRVFLFFPVEHHGNFETGRGLGGGRRRWRGRGVGGLVVALVGSQQQPPEEVLTGLLWILTLDFSAAPAVAPGPILFLISAAMVMKACSTLVALLALVSRKGMPRLSANS